MVCCICVSPGAYSGGCFLPRTGLHLVLVDTVKKLQFNIFFSSFFNCLLVATAAATFIPELFTTPTLLDLYIPLSLLCLHFRISQRSRINLF